MDARDSRTRWQNAFIYAFLTTIMVLGTALFLQAALGGAQRDLADRVDRNSAVSVTAADAIICILQLGVNPNDPPRNSDNVLKCLEDSGYIDIPTVTEPTPSDS